MLKVTVVHTKAEWITSTSLCDTRSNLPLSNLRSKEFQRIHLPCIPQHRETSKCVPVYTEMYLGKIVVLLKEQATFTKARVALMWIRCLSLFYTSSYNNQLWE